MILSRQQTLSSKQTGQRIQSKKQTTLLANRLLATTALVGMLSLSACQTAPSSAAKTTAVQASPSMQSPKSTAPAPKTAPAVATTTIVTQAAIIENNDYPDNYPAESTNPLTQETPIFTPPSPVATQPAVIIAPAREDYMISEPSIPSHNELLERARQNSQQRTQQSAANNSDLPAFRNLMQTGTGQLKAGQLTAAENSFTRAQRLAPKSSAVYFYLAQVALKKNQPRKAEAMARRGLSVSQDAGRRRALWQVILQSGQIQGNSRVINEAKRALR